MNVSWNTGLISHLVTLLVFTFVGFGISKKLPFPRSFSLWALLVAATILSVYIGPNIEVIGIDFAGIYLNTLLVGMGLGLIIGFFVKMRGKPVSTPGAVGQR